MSRVPTTSSPFTIIGGDTILRKVSSSSSPSSSLNNNSYCTSIFLFFILLIGCLISILIPYIEANEANQRIQGGEQATSHEFPFLVSLHYKSLSSSTAHHKCGGSIISKRFILTAGHCAYGSTTSNYAVVMGITSLSECTATANEIFSSSSSGSTTILSTTSCVVARVKTMHLHPSYDDNSLNNDIALFELYDEIAYSSTIRPVHLASSIPSINSMLVVSGWGLTSDITNTASNHLMKATVPYVEEKYCNALGLDVSATNGKLCAGAGDGKDACAGDSGSALFQVVNSTTFIEIGVVSYGPLDCGTQAAYKNRGVYTIVPFHKEWIYSISNVSVGSGGVNQVGGGVGGSGGSSSLTNVSSSILLPSILISSVGGSNSLYNWLSSQIVPNSFLNICLFIVIMVISQ